MKYSLLVSFLASFLLLKRVESQSSCSKGADPVECDETAATCADETIIGCETSCFESCTGATFIDSSVSCSKETSYSSSCRDAYFNQSKVALNNVECQSCVFWASALTTNGPFSSYSTQAPSFGLCSCCDDSSGSGSCPEGVPSCSDDPMGFCSESHHFRNCKDWGNPICADLNLPSAESKTTAASCSVGVDTVWCTDDSVCNGIEVKNCTILCGVDSCEDSLLENSVVGCIGGTSSWSHSCGGTTFNHSFVDLQHTECNSCSFQFSAVTTDGPFSSSSSWMPAFWYCSCCDDTSGDGNCPEGVPSCSKDPLEFCSESHHFRTCKDWGNPLCKDLDVPSLMPKTEAGTCSAGVNTLWCANEGSCDGLEADNCTVICGKDSCKNSILENSVVGCYQKSSYGDSCESSTFYRSVIELESECKSCTFWFSAVSTNRPFNAYLEPTFGFCSCCSDTSGEGNCPEGVPSCDEDNLYDFCATSRLGMSCKDWGNPLCADIDIEVIETIENMTNASTNGTLPSFSMEQECSISGENKILECVDIECEGVAANNCTVACYDNACTSGVFEDSGIACLGEDTCTSSKFYRSLVDCTNSDCTDSDYFSSSLACSSSEESYNKGCKGVTLSRCSCCDGDDCPTSASLFSCYEDPFIFCNSTFAGRTCKDWQHPMCEGIDIPSAPPLHPSETCNLGEDIVICDEGDNGCLGLGATNCTVLCSGEVCSQGMFVDSFVGCIDRAIAGFFTVFPGEGCVSANFVRSVVSCQNSCVGASFEASYVRCIGPSCTQTSFDECSCCDGDSCPVGIPGIPTCEGNADAICSRVVDGETCACRGFPACKEEDLADCPLQRSGHGFAEAAKYDFSIFP